MKNSPFGFLPPRSAPAPHFRIVLNFYAVSENGDGVKIGGGVRTRTVGCSNVQIRSEIGFEISVVPKLILETE